ncbi:MAG: DNA cytosine methyltransferase [Sulfurospirillaceae bacterium]|nr:DNA cytosine methyltransferase [Sulfurospirillaceae bacterium]
MTYFMERNLFTMDSQKNTKRYKAIDLFAGIGGIRLGFERAFGNKIEFVFASEIDKYACETYYANFGEKPCGDITKIDEKNIPPFDILLAGFPCQAFSVAGLRKGFEDTRGTLFFEIARILKHHKPKVVFLENVKGFKNHDKGTTFKVIKETLEELGYKVFSQVLNAKDFGVPQNRERIYIIGFLDSSVEFEFPEKEELGISIENCLEEKVEEKYYYTNKVLFEKLKDEVVCQETVYQWRRQYVRANKSKVCPTLTANMGTGGHNVPIIKDKFGIRKLTPRECANFQGFPKDFILPGGLVDSQLYKQCGNSVVVKVVEDIAQLIKKGIDKNV